MASHPHSTIPLGLRDTFFGISRHCLEPNGEHTAPNSMGPWWPFGVAHRGSFVTTNMTSLLGDSLRLFGGQVIVAPPGATFLPNPRSTVDFPQPVTGVPTKSRKNVISKFSRVRLATCAADSRILWRTVACPSRVLQVSGAKSRVLQFHGHVGPL